MFNDPEALKVWIYILLDVTHTYNTRKVNGCLVELYPGQTIFGRLQWNKNLNISGSKIYRIINLMKDTGMIDIFSTNRYSVISVCNWSEYQSRKSEHQNEHLTEHQNEHVESIDNSELQEYEEQQNGQPMNNQTTQYKNGKNEKNNNYSKQEENIFNFWNSKKIIVHKLLNKDMVNEINKALKNYTIEEIYESISNYAEVYHDKNYFFKYKWSLENFLSRKKVLKKFLTDGENYHNYLDHKKESNQNTFKSQNNGSNNNYQKNTVRGAAETSKSINEIKKKMEAS